MTPNNQVRTGKDKVTEIHTGELLSAGEGKGVGSVLEKNGAARRHVADLRGVIALNVDVLVDDLVASLGFVEAVAVCVKCPRVEVDLWGIVGASNIVEGSL